VVAGKEVVAKLLTTSSCNDRATSSECGTVVLKSLSKQQKRPPEHNKLDDYSRFFISSIALLAVLRFASFQRGQWHKFSILLESNNDWPNSLQQLGQEIKLFTPFLSDSSSSSTYLSTINLPPIHKSKHSRDYGGLKYTSLRDHSSSFESFERRISRHDEEKYLRWKKDQLEAMNHHDHTWDGDNVDIVDKHGCQSPSFTKLYFSTCNSVHELDYGRQDQDLDIHLLTTSGYYREPWLFK
jgi:hypothetical protein